MLHFRNLKTNKTTEFYFLVSIICFYFLSRLNNIFLDLDPIAFIDEGLYSHNVYGMYFDSKYYNSAWYPPDRGLAGGFTYYICFIPTKIVSLFMNDFNINTSEKISRTIVLGLSLLVPIYLYKSLLLLGSSVRVSLCALLILTLSPYLLSVTRIVYPDHFMPGLVMMLVYYMIRLSTEQVKMRDIVIIGLLFGAIISTKYSGALLIPSIFIPMFFIILYQNNWRVSALKKVVIYSIYVILISFLVFFILTHKGLFAGDVLYALRDATTRYNGGGQMGASTNEPVIFYAKIIFLLTFGFMGLPLILIGVFELLNKKKYSIFLFILLAFAVFFISVLPNKMAFPRNSAYLAPLVFLLTGMSLNVIERLLIIINSKISLRSTKLIISALTLVFFFEPTVRTFIQLSNDYRSDSREAANKWITENASFKKVGYIHGGWGGPYTDDKTVKPVLLPMGSATLQNFNDVDFFIYDSWQVDVYDKGNSMFSFRPFSELHFNNTVKAPIQNIMQSYKNLLSHFEQVATFSNKDYYGPTVYIYKNTKKTLPNAGRNLINNGNFDRKNMAMWKLYPERRDLKLSRSVSTNEAETSHAASWNIINRENVSFLEQHFDINKLSNRKFGLTFYAKLQNGTHKFSSHSYLLPNGVLDNSAVIVSHYPTSFTLNKSWQKFTFHMSFPSVDFASVNSESYGLIRPLFVEGISNNTIFIKSIEFRELK